MSGTAPSQICRNGLDPAAVQRMIQAGVGAQITLALGGKLSMPAIGLSGQPRTVTGRVQLISDGRHTNLGPMYRGEAVDMGLSAVLDTGRVQIVVISNHVEPHDLAAFTVPPVGCRLGAAGVATPLHLRDGACVVCRQPLPRPVLLTAFGLEPVMVGAASR